MINIETDNFGVVTLQMEHGKVNAMDLEFCQRLCQTLSELAADESLAVIVTGHGRVFSAGVDLVRLLHEIESGAGDYLDAFLESLTQCFHAFFAFPKPLIAAINGHAIAGGCILASACDRRIIHDRARIGLPELRVGVPLPSIAIETIRFVATNSALQAMVYAGQNYRGQSAVDVGLADEVVPVEALMSCARAAAAELITLPSAVFSITKSQLRADALARATAGEAALENRVRGLWRQPQVQAAIRQYVTERL